MAEILLFHHAQGLTEGCLAFADELRVAGHVVRTPDVYEGRTFGTLAEGIAHAKSVGFDTLADRGTAAAEGMPAELVYAGFSLGVMPAQKLAQTRPGARGALLLHGCADPSYFGPWPGGVRAQIHTMTDDDWGDADVGRAMADAIADVELFLYPGSQHLFTDRSLAEYDEAAAALVMDRALDFLRVLG